MPAGKISMPPCDTAADSHGAARVARSHWVGHGVQGILDDVQAGQGCDCMLRRSLGRSVTAGPEGRKSGP
jgi:hypothetical protein